MHIHTHTYIHTHIHTHTHLWHQAYMSFAAQECLYPRRAPCCVRIKERKWWHNNKKKTSADSLLCNTWVHSLHLAVNSLLGFSPALPSSSTASSPTVSPRPICVLHVCLYVRINVSIYLSIYIIYMYICIYIYIYIYIYICNMTPDLRRCPRALS